MVPETDRGPDLSIEISSDLRAHVNGMPFVDAPPVSELHRELGPPARIIEAGGPAPVKHRCNQMHVHDSLGVVFNEHHYTRRLQACIVVFWTEDFDFDFAPQNAFASRLRIGGYDVSPRPELLPFLRGCPVRFEPTFKGWFRAHNGGYSVHLTAKGAKLPSGRRSKTLRLVDLSLGWPHDPWRKPL